ncbi:hypothetical protein [Agrobacterium vitis]|uniref:hypothetical protein n=1 Tax=Agrobacterium vitis TaxID=373 RepID=UPI0015D7256E|nr:hypothetical protein [Agrobacterium vitis]
MDIIGLLAFQETIRREAINRHALTPAQQEDAFYTFYSEPSWPRLRRIFSKLFDMGKRRRCAPEDIDAQAEATIAALPQAPRSDQPITPISIRP